ncbi:MAG: CRISPR-associated protein Csx16 [Thermaerobacter sp.]|jgi:CRISPR-associated protein Csx16|nr:CRISPR-associated protein Csx16 [Thermaerobacter sp.]
MGRGGVHLITFLGTHDYQDTAYQMDDQACRTRYVAEALCRLLPAAEVTVLATEEARDKHWAELRPRLERAAACGEMPLLIPHGRSEEELWQIFNLLHELVTAVLDQEGTELVVDITHGFRTQPFFAAAVLAFGLMAGQVDPGRIRVVYGEYRDEKESPIWELTPFMELLEWSHGAGLFLKSGQADDLVALASRLDRARRATLAREGAIRFPETRRLIEALRRFSADLALVRLWSLTDRDGSAAKLHQALKDYGQEAEHNLPALAKILDQVRRMVSGLSTPTLQGEEGRLALVALGKLYLRLCRYPELAIVIREGWISLYAEDARATDCRDFARENRDRAEERWRGQAQEARTIADFRNDLEHGGLNPCPKPADSLARGLRELLEHYEAAGVTRGTVWFVSRHPGAREWAARQGFAVDETVAHLDPAQVQPGDVVLGNLPVHLAAELCAKGAQYWHLSLEVPAERRGQELSAADMERYGARLERYQVTSVGE